MDCPELYVKENGLQRRDVIDISNKFLEKMIWKPNEIVLDVGCGPGDVTSDILYSILQNKIGHLVGVDKSSRMIEYSKRTYGCSKLDFKVLDIENANDCAFHYQSFSKIFSFFCFHWVNNKLDALVNIHSMLKSGGDLLIHFLLTNPLVELYKSMDVEWQKYFEDIKQPSYKFYSQEDVQAIVINAGFRIVKVDSNVKKYTFPDFSSVLNALKPIDNMYNVIPSHLHDRYSMHVKDKICEKQMADICPITGKTTIAYLPITIHAVKD